MNFHILHSKKIIIFWNPKSGVTSIIEMIMHLTDGLDHSNPNYDQKTHQDYWNNFRPSGEIIKNLEELHDYKKVIFVRNPFHRIVSCFLDKYVDSMSVSTKDIPECNTFYEFVKILNSTGLVKEKMHGKVDYTHFCKLTQWRGWDFYCKLGKPKFDMIVSTPVTALPEGKIVHDHKQIKLIYELVNCKDDYDGIKHLYEKNYYSYDVWKVFKPKIRFETKNFAKTPIEELKKYHGYIGKDRTIPYENFYTSHCSSIIYNLYKEEFDFYENQLGIKFTLNNHDNIK